MTFYSRDPHIFFGRYLFLFFREKLLKFLRVSTLAVTTIVSSKQFILSSLVVPFLRICDEWILVIIMKKLFFKMSSF
jgi:hypothetical protein